MGRYVSRSGVVMIRKEDSQMEFRIIECQGKSELAEWLMAYQMCSST